VTLDAVMVTDVGVVRDHNEDSALIDPEGAFYVVADGMGGHAAGEVASAMAVETVSATISAARDQINAFTADPTDQGRRDLVQLLQNAVLAAHQAVFQRGNREADKQGMGTTLDVVLVAGHEAFVAHVGDSRTYLIRDHRAAQITTDHTVAEVLVIEGKLSIEEAQVSPLRTILVNAIGVSADVGVEMAHLQLRTGDRLLLCSDGLHDYFAAEQEIADKLSEDDPGQGLHDMVELAKERGGHDNITGVMVNVLDVRPHAEAVPGLIEMDQTQPVDVGVPPPEPPPQWDDENTENLPEKDRPDVALRAKEKAEARGEGEAEARDEAEPPEDVATRSTAPMPAATPVGEPPSTEAVGEPADVRTTVPMRVLSKSEVENLKAIGKKADETRAAEAKAEPVAADDDTAEATAGSDAGDDDAAGDDDPATGDSDETVEMTPAKAGPAGRARKSQKEK